MTTSWRDLFDDMNLILRSTGAIFEDCDRLLDNHGFAPAHTQKNRIERESRGNIDQSWGWYPGWFARQYKDRKSPAILYVAIFLHDCGGKEDYSTKTKRLEEPLVTAGVLHYETGSRWHHWHCKTWFWNNDGIVGGPPVKSELSGHKSSDGQALSFAIRLVELRGKQDIDAKIIQPLLALVS